MMGIKNTKKQNSLNDKRVVWSRLILEMCEYCKNNILDSNMVNHHGSSGKVYSFGYQGVFKQIKNSSVGLYGVRKRFEDERQEDVEHTARIIEEKIAFEMSVASKTLSNVVEYADKLFLPMLDIASKMQSTYGNISLNKDKEQCSSMWNTHVCINASTQEFHTEKDTSYTLITVPAQDSKAQNVCCNTYHFLFKLNKNVIISLPLTPDLSFIFSGTYLSHQQEGNNCTEKNTNPFVNLSSYGNKRLFTHIRKSFFRNLNTKH